MKYGLKELTGEDRNMKKIKADQKKRTPKVKKKVEKSDRVLAEKVFGLQHSGWFTSTDVGMEVVEKMSKSGPRTVFSLEEQTFVNVTGDKAVTTERPIKMYRVVEWQSEKDFWGKGN